MAEAQLVRCRCESCCPWQPPCPNAATQEDWLCDVCRVAVNGNQEDDQHCHTEMIDERNKGIDGDIDAKIEEHLRNTLGARRIPYIPANELEGSQDGTAAYTWPDDAA